MQSKLLDAKTATFAQYVDATWINGSFPPSLWSHFDNVGPRTTNLAEGWHNGLNTTLGVSHPSIRTFLDWLQRYQFEIQCRCMQLSAGRPPKERRIPDFTLITIMHIEHFPGLYGVVDNVVCLLYFIIVYYCDYFIC